MLGLQQNTAVTCRHGVGCLVRLKEAQETSLPTTYVFGWLWENQFLWSWLGVQGEHLFPFSDPFFFSRTSSLSSSPLMTLPSLLTELTVAICSREAKKSIKTWTQNGREKYQWKCTLLKKYNGHKTWMSTNILQDRKFCWMWNVCPVCSSTYNTKIVFAKIIII